MSYIIIGKTLRVADKPIYLKVYNTDVNLVKDLVLDYVDFSINEEKTTANARMVESNVVEVLPVDSFVGNYTLNLQVKNTGYFLNVPIFYESEYTRLSFKSNVINSLSEHLPKGFMKTGSRTYIDPADGKEKYNLKQIEIDACDNVFLQLLKDTGFFRIPVQQYLTINGERITINGEEIYLAFLPDWAKERLKFPLLREAWGEGGYPKNMFPNEYRKNSVLGIALQLSLKEAYKENPNRSEIVVGLNVSDQGIAPSSINDFILEGNPVGEPDEKTGKYKEIKYTNPDKSENNYSLFYGGVLDENDPKKCYFTGSIRAMYFFRSNGGNAAPITEWKNLGGIPVTMELIYSDEIKAINSGKPDDKYNFDLFAKFPRKENVLLGEYEPEKWVSAATPRINRLAITYEKDKYGLESFLVKTNKTKIVDYLIFDGTAAQGFDSGLFKE